MKIKKLPIILILIIAVIFRLWRLDNLPAEMWGDVITGYQFTQRVLQHNYFWQYEFGGDGPLFFYLTAIVSKFMGLSFLSMKTTTSIIGIITVIAVYYLAKIYTKNTSIGYISALLVAISKWSVIFSRMAKPCSLVPLLSIFSVLFLFKFQQTGKHFFAILGGIVLGLGMYSQAAFWGVPIAALLLMIIRPKKNILLFIFPAIILVLPFLQQIVTQSGYFFSSSSYIGGKISLPDISIIEKIRIFSLNFVRNQGMFHIRGDEVFRDNPPFTPHLDFLSGLFMLIGAILINKYNRIKPKWLTFWIPFFLMQIPSLLDIRNQDVPNAGRSIAIFPWVYILVAIGIWWTVQKINKFVIPKTFSYALILLIISIFNYQYVFRDWAFNLPNHNTPFGKIIAQKIDSLPINTKVYIYGCCWGDWGQPELDGITYSLKDKSRKINFINNYDSLCTINNLPSSKYYYFLDPRDHDTINKLKTCLKNGNQQNIISHYNDIIYLEYTNI